MINYNHTAESLAESLGFANKKAMVTTHLQAMYTMQEKGKDFKIADLPEDQLVCLVANAAMGNPAMLFDSISQIVEAAMHIKAAGFVETLEESVVEQKDDVTTAIEMLEKKLVKLP